MEQERSEETKRWSCTQIGCGIMVILFLALVGLYMYEHAWRSSKISLPDGSGSVIFKARESKAPDPWYVRTIIFETNSFKDIQKLLPDDYPPMDSSTNVYWYPKEQGAGPYLRLQDPNGEYLVDLKHGITLAMVRTKDGSCYAGEILRMHSSVHKYDPGDDTPIVEVDGQPAKKLPGFIAHNTGKYLGRINKDYEGFTPASKAPEVKIETFDRN